MPAPLLRDLFTTALLIAHFNKARTSVAQKETFDSFMNWRFRSPYDPIVDCLDELTTGRKYLLYLSFGTDGVPRTSLCSGNLPAEQAAGRIRSLGLPIS